jgi:hypothetical protein
MCFPIFQKILSGCTKKRKPDSPNKICGLMEFQDFSANLLIFENIKPETCVQLFWEFFFKSTKKAPRNYQF